jgi:hypothetical protein
MLTGLMYARDRARRHSHEIHEQQRRHSDAIYHLVDKKHHEHVNISIFLFIFDCFRLRFSQNAKMTHTRKR